MSRQETQLLLTYSFLVLVLFFWLFSEEYWFIYLIITIGKQLLVHHGQPKNSLSPGLPFRQSFLLLPLRTPLPPTVTLDLRRKVSYLNPGPSSQQKSQEIQQFS